MDRRAVVEKSSRRVVSMRMRYPIGGVIPCCCTPTSCSIGSKLDTIESIVGFDHDDLTNGSPMFVIRFRSLNLTASSKRCFEQKLQHFYFASDTVYGKSSP